MRYVQIVVVLLIACGFVFADPPAEKPKTVRVIITKIDGTKLSGVLQVADHDGLTIQQNPKADAMAVKWADIKSVSNGLTREKAVAAWKLEHADQLCETCKGDRTLSCKTCSGSGVDQAQKTPCKTCNESGSIGPCKAKKCKEGKVDCPNTCLKLSEGTWKIREGKNTREFKTKNGGWMWWSDNHLGELIVMEDGMPVNKGKCPTCSGTTKVDCSTCSGTGKEKCIACKGVGYTGPACPDCDHGQSKCEACGGDGLK